MEYRTILTVEASEAELSQRYGQEIVEELKVFLGEDQVSRLWFPYSETIGVLQRLTERIPQLRLELRTRPSIGTLQIAGLLCEVGESTGQPNRSRLIVVTQEDIEVHWQRVERVMDQLRRDRLKVVESQCYFVEARPC